MTTSKESSNGWTRNAVTFRLSPRRRQGLRALCGDEADSLSPTAALDRAIALAGETLAKDVEPVNTTGVQSGNSGKALDRQNFDELFAQVREEGQQLRDFLAGQTIRSGEILAAITCQIKELRQAITTATGEGENDFSVDSGIEGSHAIVTQDPQKPTRVFEWLELEAIGLPRPSFILKAQWRATRRVSRANVVIELALQRVASAGISGPTGQGPVGLVQLECPLSQSRVLAELAKPYLRCQREANTWCLDLGEVDAAGRLGETLQSSRFIRETSGDFKTTDC